MIEQTETHPHSVEECYPGTPASASTLGMWLFLSSEILLFAGLFALYAAYRVMYPADFGAAIQRTDKVLGSINTAILVTSSLTLSLALRALEGERLRRAMGLIVCSIVIGVVFLVLKGVEYAEHVREGFVPGPAYSNKDLPTYGAKMFFSLYYTLTGLHAIHVLAGLCVLGWMAWSCARGVLPTVEASVPPVAAAAVRVRRLELGALYWSMVDVVWLFLWPMLYLMGR